MHFSLHKEGIVSIIISFIITLIALSISTSLGLICLFLSVLVCYFFRDPERIIPNGSDIMVSAADGIITAIDHNISLPQELTQSKKNYTRISTFLNVLNVHVNRIPIEGTVEKLLYIPGKFINATLDKSSTDNERQHIMIKTSQDEELVVTQIAGLIARRIICSLYSQQKVACGERLGIIKFGSRVDVYIPANFEIKVTLGQTMVGGETILATRKEKSTAKKKND